MDEGCLLTAYERTGAHLDHDIEVETTVQYVVAKQAIGARLSHGMLEPLDGQGILGADVYVRARGSDGVGCDDHPFQQPVRVAFGHRPIHEGARVALVGIADEVALALGRLSRQLPLPPCWEASTTPTAQTTLQHGGADFVWG